MQSSDIQKLGHIQTHCRNILFYVSLCGNDYARFAADQKFCELVRVALYHIGELAEIVNLPQETEYWRSVCALSSIRTKDVNSMNMHVVWDWIQTELPKLLEFCETTKYNG